MYGGPSIGRKWLPRDKLADDCHSKGETRGGQERSSRFSDLLFVVSLILLLGIIAVRRRNCSGGIINETTCSSRCSRNLSRSRKLSRDDALRMPSFRTI